MLSCRMICIQFFANKSVIITCVFHSIKIKIKVWSITLGKAVDFFYFLSGL